MHQKNLLEAIFHLMFAVKTKLLDELVAEGIKIAPMHIKLLKILSIKSPCTAQNLAGILNRDKAQITRLVQDLLAFDLIYRTPNPDDKRSQLLSLNQKATQTLNQMNSIEKRIIEDMCQDISIEQQELFISLAGKFHANIISSEDFL